ncbi:MAG TPA: phage tail tape measure protein, partial [Candidatus Bathyarchaeia archaeon]|nr:phage tail tape measure protein [Candidatus Bathyarchaeia archaeon]
MANDITAGKAFVIFGAKFGPLDKALKKLNAKVRKTGDSLTAIGARMTAVGTAIVAPFAASTKAFSTFGDSIAKMSRRTGVSTEALSGLAHATELSGSTLAVLEKGLRGMARGLFDAKRGTGEMKDAMTELNLKYTDLEGLSPEEQFFKISDAIKGVQDPTIKAALAMKIFGRAGSELVPLMDEGSDGMRKMMKDAADLGLVLDSKTAKQAEILTDQMLRAGRSIRALSIVIGATLAPTVSFLSDKLIAVSKTFIGFIKENKGLVISIAATGAAIIAVGGTILSLGVAITGLSIIMPGVISLFSGLFAIFSPMGLLIGALI